MKRKFGLSSLLILLGLIFTVGCASLNSIDDDKVLDTAARDKIASLAQDSVDRGFAPGVVIHIQESNKEPFIYAYGERSRETSAPQEIDDLFRIYSMTKPVSVVAALTLVDDGVIALDDPVARYIPAFEKTRVYAGGATIADMETAPLDRPLTVRDLMRHTAGMTYKSAKEHPVHQLYVLRGIDTGSGADIPPQDGSEPIASSAEFADRIAAIPLLNQPGARFTYGNSTDVLGRVVEVASNERLGAYMKRRIFDPLGMKGTFFLVPRERQARMTSAYSAQSTAPGEGGVLNAAAIDELQNGMLTLADPAQGGVFSKKRMMDYGGAGLVSTASDFTRFAQMLLNEGALDGVRILSVEAVAEMTRNQLSEEALAAADGLTKEGLVFGLGVAIVADEKAARIAAPAGAYFWGGAASTNFWIDPENDVTGVVMTQVFGGDFRTFYLEMLDAIYHE